MSERDDRERERETERDRERGIKGEVGMQRGGGRELSLFGDIERI